MNFIKKIKQFREKIRRIDYCSIPAGSTVTLCASIDDDEAFEESVEDDFFSCEEPPEEATVIEKAVGLPEEWIWTHYEDGSGHLNSPSGIQFFSYDLMTQEYSFCNGFHYSFMEDYEYGIITHLNEFTAFAEKKMADYLAKLHRLFQESIANGISTLGQLYDEHKDNDPDFRKYETEHNCIISLLNERICDLGPDFKLSVLSCPSLISEDSRRIRIHQTFHQETDPSELWCIYSIHENGQLLSKGYTSVDYDEWLSYGDDENMQNQLLFNHIEIISQKEKIDLASCSEIMKLCVEYIEWSDAGICDFTFGELMEKDMSRDDFEAFDSDISNMDLGTDINVPRSLTDIYDSMPADSEEGYDNVIIECNPGLLDYFEFANISDE